MSLDARNKLRQYRKEVLRLRAARYRLALEHDLATLFAAPRETTRGVGTKRWLEMLSALLTLVPSKWSRMLGAGLAAWRLARRFFPRRERPAA